MLGLSIHIYPYYRTQKQYQNLLEKLHIQRLSFDKSVNLFSQVEFLQKIQLSLALVMIPLQEMTTTMIYQYLRKAYTRGIMSPSTSKAYLPQS